MGSNTDSITMTGEFKDDNCPECDGKGYIHCKDCGEHVKCHRCGGSGKKATYNGIGYVVHWDSGKQTAPTRIWYTFS